MLYDFYCDEHKVTDTVRASISDGPGAPPLCPIGDHPMTRVWGSQARAIVTLDGPAYADKAYRGEEKVPGLTLRSVRAMIDADHKRKTRGRANGREYHGR